MWFILLIVSCTSLLVNSFGNVEILGKGRWLVQTILQCEDPDQYEVPMELTRKKMNRYHDAYSFNCEIQKEFDDTYGVDIIAYKEVDGGYKFYQQITDDSFCNMAKKYIGSNWDKILKKANIDPPDCPIPVGTFRIEDYVIDYRELEETGMYGKYDAYIYITYMRQRISCLRVLVQFEKVEDDGDDCDDD